MEIHAQKMQQQGKPNKLLKLETAFDKIRQKNLNKQIDNSIYSLPVIVHIIHNGEDIGIGANISYEQIMSQFDVLYEDFRRVEDTPGNNNNSVGADSHIEFCPVLIDNKGDTLPEPGINRINRNDYGFTIPPYVSNYIEETIKPNTYWNPNQYLNIWVLNLWEYRGYAQFPEIDLDGLSDIVQEETTDGIVVHYEYFGRIGNVLYPYDKGRTTTHEIGHFLGLRHIWGDGGCGIDDYCNDTPPANSANTTCDPSSSCSSDNMIQNYMDYSYDACKNIFTECQSERMHMVLDNAIRRNSLLYAETCGSQYNAPTANFTANFTEGSIGLIVQFYDASNFSPTQWQWTFHGGTPTTSTTQNPMVVYDNEGVFDVSLTVSNIYGESTYTLEDYITIDNSNTISFFEENWENDGFNHNNWTIDNPDGDLTWEITTVNNIEPEEGYAARVNHFDYNNPAQRDALISPIIDCTNQTNISLELEYAYKLYSPSYFDSLIIYASVNNGNTYTRLYQNDSNTFPTGYPSTQLFIPASNTDWCFDSDLVTNCIHIDLNTYAGESMLRLKFETYNDYGNCIYIDNINCKGNYNEVVTPTSIIQAKAYLEGAYTNDSMGNSLYQHNLLPLVQPYGGSPWFYDGTESVNNYTDIPNNAVDWVLVELRYTDNDKTLIETRAAWLLQNGAIVDVDGLTNGLNFYKAVANQMYYIAIRHRNHIDVMSNAPVLLSNETSYDFTNYNNVMGGNRQLANMGNNNYALYNGDCNGDGRITYLDFNYYTQEIDQNNLYKNSDCNFDGLVSLVDLNAFWTIKSTVGVSCLRY